MPFVRDPVTGLVSIANVQDTNKVQTSSEPEIDAVKTRWKKYLEEEGRGAPSYLSYMRVPGYAAPPIFRIGPKDSILLPESEDNQEQTCPNSRDHRGLSLSYTPRLQNLDAYDPESPFMNLLAEICSRAEIHRCSNQKCKIKLKRLTKLAPRCEWDGFRDWALQLLSCQLSLRDDQNFNKSFFYMAKVVDIFYNLLYEAMGRGYPISGTLYGADGTKVKLEAFDIFEMIYWMLTIQNSISASNVLTNRWSVDFLPADITEPAVQIASQGAHTIGICQARFWKLGFSTQRQHIDLPGIIDAAMGHPELKHHDHERCTPVFCKFTALDSTKVKQLHTCSNSSDHTSNGTCNELFFDPDQLNQSVSEGKRTVWSTTSPFQVTQEEPYIAISHVWSDGTGIGQKPPGKVNHCLFKSLANIASRLDCKGIWWDAISIPTDAELRKIAICAMHKNYAQAKHTVLHDRYLMNFEWTDDGAPCLALIFSTWFTRGWTALELIMSKSIKVLFKGTDGDPLIKDLDEDVLAKNPFDCTRGHWIASTAIRRLRQEIHNVSDLVAVLKPRSTSWPRDRMVIAGLLSGVEDVDYKREIQDITKDIINRVVHINPSSLHHGEPTMTERGGWSWCPPSLYELPSETVGDLYKKDSIFDNTCLVDKNGTLVGAWHWRPLEKTDSVSGRLIPNTQHVSVILKIKNAIRRYQYCMLLKQTNTLGGLGLLVLPVRRTNGFIHVKFVGSVNEVETRSRSMDERFSFDFFKIGVDADGNLTEWKAQKFYPGTVPWQKGPSSENDYSWVCGKLWIGNHKSTGQIMIVRHGENTDILEGFSLAPESPVLNCPPSVDSSNNYYYKTLLLARANLVLSHEPLFRVHAKSGRGVDDVSSVALRKVTPDQSWPPPSIPAVDRIWLSTSKADTSNNLLKLNDGLHAQYYAALQRSVFIPDESHPYKGVWTCLSLSKQRPVFVLFQQPHSNRLEAIALTGDGQSTTNIIEGLSPPGSVHFTVDYLDRYRRHHGDERFNGVSVVDAKYPDRDDPQLYGNVELFLMSKDEVFLSLKDIRMIQYRRVHVDRYLTEGA